MVTVSNEGYQKTLEEILRERADVLSRAGRNLSAVLDELKILEYSISGKIESFQVEVCDGGTSFTRRVLREINEEIDTYNQTREQARLKYYYLVVTREALGLRKHQWIEKIYRIPPKKRTLK